MVTELQTIATDRIVETAIKNGGKVSVSKIMREVVTPSGKRYSENTAHTPQKLTDSQGYKERLQTYGLTAGLITKSLVSDIKAKPKNRVPELRLGAEILGLTEREGSGNKTLIINVTGESATRFRIPLDTEASGPRPA